MRRKGETARRGRGDSVDTAAALGTHEESSYESLPAKYHPVDTGWAWVIMIGVFVIHFLTTGYLRSFGMLFVEFQNNFNSSSTITATMNGVQMLSYSLCTFFTMNFWIKYVSVKMSCLVGCCMELLSVVGNSLVTDVKQLILTHGVLYGLGQALIYCPSMVILSEYFDKKRPIATVIATGGVSAGGVIMPLLIRHVINSYGLEGGLLILAGVIFQQAVFVSLFTAPSEYTAARRGSIESASDSESEHTYRGYASENGKTPVDVPISIQSESFTEKIALGATCNAGNFKVSNEQFTDVKNVTPGNTYTKVCALPKNDTTRSENGSTYEHIDHKLRSCENISTGHHRGESKCDTEFYELRNPNEEKSLRLLNSSEIDTTKRSDNWLLPPSPTLRRGSSQETVRTNSGRPRPSLLPQGLREGDTLARALSTSSIDVLGSIHPLSAAGSMTSVRRRCRNDSVLESQHVSSLNHHHNKPQLAESRARRLRLPSCRLPAMARRPAFWLVAAFFCCGGVASCLPVVFLPPMAKSLGLSEMEASYFLVVSAFMEMLGRLVPGLILHFGYMRPTTVVIPSMVCCGILLQTVRLFTDFQSLMILSGFIGFFTGAFWGMQVLVVIEVIGMETLGSAFGFYSIVLGFSIGCGFPLTGALADFTGGYMVPYHCFGALYLMAAVTMILIQFTRRSGDMGDSLPDVCDEGDDEED